MLDDETLRDGLQSPSVRTPTIDEKIEILHHMDALGIDTADIGLPGAGPKVARDVERLARAIGDGKLKIRANCAARTMVADIKPIAEIQQRTGVPIECGAFIGSSPIRQYAEGWTLDYLQKCTEDAIAFAVKEGLTVMYVTEDTTRADPESLRRLFTTAIRAGAKRLCVADTVGHATPNGAQGGRRRSCKSLIAELGVDVGIDWHGHRDRGFGVASSLAALEAGATRLHGAALGIGERCGNTPIDLLLVNLAMMGYRDHDLTGAAGLLPGGRARVRRADRAELPGDRRRRVPHRHRRPRRGGGQGVPEGRPRADGRGLRGRARQPGRPPAGNRGRPDVGPIERHLLAREPRPAGDRRDRRSHLRRGEGSNRTLTHEQVQSSPARTRSSNRPARSSARRRGF